MAYLTKANMTQDFTLLLRIAACATEYLPQDRDPLMWANKHKFSLVSSEGWAEAWEQATESSNYEAEISADGEYIEPILLGKFSDVITDEMIELSVQSLIAQNYL